MVVDTLSAALLGGAVIYLDSITAHLAVAVIGCQPAAARVGDNKTFRRDGVACGLNDPCQLFNSVQKIKPILG